MPLGRSKLTPLMEDILAHPEGARAVHEAVMTGRIQLAPKASGGKAVVFMREHVPLLQRKLREYRRRQVK